MSEMLKPNDGEQQERSSGYEVAEDMPKFDPERAQELWEAHKEGIGESETDTDDDEEWYDEEARAQRMEKLKPRIDFNQEAYEGLAKRKLYWQMQFPDWEDAPKSVRSEVELGDALMHSLLDSATMESDTAMQLVRGVNGERASVDPSMSDKYNESLAIFQARRKENEGMVDEEAVAAIELTDNLEDAGVDVYDLDNRFWKANSLNSKRRLLFDIQDKAGTFGIHAALALTDLYGHLKKQFKHELEMAKAGGGEEMAGEDMDGAGEGIGEAEVPSAETRESRKDANRDMYNDLVKRRAFLMSQYPDLNDAPSSIVDEYDATSSLINYLRNGVSATIHGAELKQVPDGSAVAIDMFHRNVFDDAMKRVGEAQEKNIVLLNPDAEAAFELPKVDVAEYEKRLAEATNDQEVLALSSEVSKLAENTDMDTMYALAKNLDYNARLAEIKERGERDKVDLKTQRLQSALEQSQQELASAREEYQKAGLFGKLGLKLRGKANFKALEASVAAASAAMNEWHSDAEYRKFYSEQSAA